MVDILDTYKEDEEYYVAMHSDMEADEFEQADYESSDDESDHAESHN